MKKFHVLILIFLGISINSLYSQTDSLAATPTSCYHKGDTLVNYNTLLGGVTEIVIPSGVDVPSELTISKEGYITLSSDLDKPVSIEMRITGASGEVYICNLKVIKKYGTCTVWTGTDKIDMATGLRKNGMIWVVVAVSCILFAVLIAYLILLGSKLKSLENKIK
jgi:hypothetical protein